MKLLRSAFGPVAERFGLNPINCPTHPSCYDLHRLQEDMLAGKQFHLMHDDGVLCGCVAVQKLDSGVWKIGRLAVIPSRQRSGVGRKLVEYAIRLSGSRGARQVMLDMYADHDELLRWYTRQGFVVVEKFRTERFPLPIARMVRPVLGTPAAQFQFQC